MTTSSADVIRAIMADRPQLSAFGFGVFNLRANWQAKSQADREAELAELRAQMLLPHSIDEFDKARDWLRRWHKTARLNPRAGNSYGLKHVAQPHTGYVTNGMFIAAAYAEGFAVKRLHHGPNAIFNITVRARRFIAPTSTTPPC